MRRSACLFTFCALLFVVQGLRCRPENQHTDAQFDKVMQICKRRQNGQRTNPDSAETSASTDESGESRDDIFDRRFLLRKNDRHSDNRTGIQSDRPWANGSGKRKDQNNESPRYYEGRRVEQDFRNRRSGGRNEEWGRTDSQNTKDIDCLMQCIFNELNIVDLRGYPEKDSLIRLMTQNVQDPELKDFLQEAIVECFLYVETDLKRNKCDYSQTLLTCLVEKGKERCEDW